MEEKKKLRRLGCFSNIFSLFLILLVLYLFRYPILREAGQYLIYENEPEKVEAIFVLSGSPFDRANAAANLYKKGLAPTVITVGRNIPHDFKAFGLEVYESQLTKNQLINEGVDSTAIIVIPEGTSTMEEAEIILKYSLKHNLNSVIIVSSDFHTRRVKQVFKKMFEKEAIEVNIQGAASSVYDEEAWWKDEYGLIAVNNEYVKLIYYLFK